MKWLKISLSAIILHLYLTLTCVAGAAIAKPPTVTATKPVMVVVGAGPVGLATAIVAAMNGWDVHVLEIRPPEKSATRTQVIFLDKTSMEFLRRMGVTEIPESRIQRKGVIGTGLSKLPKVLVPSQIGVTQIGYLQDRLKARITALKSETKFKGSIEIHYNVPEIQTAPIIEHKHSINDDDENSHLISFTPNKSTATEEIKYDVLVNATGRPTQYRALRTALGGVLIVGNEIGASTAPLPPGVLSVDKSPGEEALGAYAIVSIVFGNTEYIALQSTKRNDQEMRKVMIGHIQNPTLRTKVLDGKNVQVESIGFPISLYNNNTNVSVEEHRANIGDLTCTGSFLLGKNLNNGIAELDLLERTVIKYHGTAASFSKYAAGVASLCGKMMNNNLNGSITFFGPKLPWSAH